MHSSGATPRRFAALGTRTKTKRECIRALLHLSSATFRQTANHSIRKWGRALEQGGVKAIDALHVACAEASNCDYLLTCDKRLISRCKELRLRVINPAGFILERDDAN